ncbi:S8 family serine peptidase [Halorussus halophilus]|uniref:S8 family serine peptidase n=1 Tax=Halorussus halophilus TaxID=2650975 RepID=UPI0013010C2F|nr:S8 family serine peptidase [Halorussus halophilus]
MADVPNFDRRSFLKATGAAGVASTVGFSGTAAAGDTILDDAFDLSLTRLHEALVVFDSRDDVDELDTLNLENGYYKFDVLPIGYTELYSDQLQALADWDSVRFVRKNEELDYYNDDGREVTGVNQVQSDLGYKGDGVHTAVIDSGVDGDHPDLQNQLVNNWQWLGNPLGSPTLWEDVGITDTDGGGHGTHCSGTIAGDGSASDGQFAGMAENADLDVYAGGAVLVVLKTAAAYDHILKRIRDGVSDVKIVSNSYGSSNGESFQPDNALNTATWEAYKEGLLSVFAAGNSGPSPNTLNQYAKAPQVLGVAATKDDKTVTDFSSRGRTHQSGGVDPDNWDRQTALNNLQDYYDTGSASGPIGVYRPGIGAPGNAIVSTMSPADALQSQSPDDGRLWYATISGTSMACPMTAGVATLVVDAYRQNNSDDIGPMELLNTLTAEAEDVHSGYTPYNIGSGFVDAYDAVSRAENGNVGTFSDTTLVSN